jgi:hypothetical protein
MLKKLKTPTYIKLKCSINTLRLDLATGIQTKRQGGNGLPIYRHDLVIAWLLPGYCLVIALCGAAKKCKKKPRIPSVFL